MFGIMCLVMKSMINSEITKCCFTGYRPAKLPFDIIKKDSAYVSFENDLFKEILKLINSGCYVFYSGMAMGFDIIAAEAVITLKNTCKSPIKLICVVPFKEQNISFNDFWRKKYDYIIENCDEVIILSEKYSKNCYHIRNKYMVDNSDFVLTWFDGKSGGTKNTVDYAFNKGRKIFNLNRTVAEKYAVQTSFELL